MTSKIRPRLACWCSTPLGGVLGLLLGPPLVAIKYMTGWAVMSGTLLGPSREGLVGRNVRRGDATGALGGVRDRVPGLRSC